MDIGEIIQVIGLIGIGGILKSVLDHFISKKALKLENRQQFKEIRYKAIIILLYSLLYNKKEKYQIRKHRKDIQSKEDLINEIRAEWTNCILFASDSVITEMKDFMNESNSTNFNRTILAMRKDLYGLKTSLTYGDLEVNF